MHDTLIEPPSSISSIPDQETRLHNLQHAIDHAGHLLPAQGPITVFIHHNTLHAFEDLTFDEGVQKGARIFGCQPYLSKERYRAELAKGRILPSDLQEVLRNDLGPRGDEQILSFGTRFDLRLAMLENRLRSGPDSELRWFIAETDALTKIREEVPAANRSLLIGKTRHWIMRDVRGSGRNHGGSQGQKLDRRVHEMLADLLHHYGESSIETWDDETWEAFSLQVLWRMCREGVHGLHSFTPPPPEPIRHRDLLLQATAFDIDSQVHEILIRFCASFLDQGFSNWRLPHRVLGFYRAFMVLYEQPAGPPDSWLQGLSAELTRLGDQEIGPLESILESLDDLGVSESEWEDYLSATLLALRGWAGMLLQIETRGDRVAHPIPEGSMLEFLAIRLILERLALRHAAKATLGFHGPLSQLRHAAKSHIDKHTHLSVDQRAFQVFQLAQVLGWLPQDLNHMPKSEWSKLVEEIEAFSVMERRRLFHMAYEHRFLTQTLDAICIQSQQSTERIPEARFQAIFCLDEREESFRRHMEEIAPDVETFSTAGFYSVSMYYKGTSDAHFIPLCPVVIRPQHWVAENVVDSLEQSSKQRAKARRLLGNATHQFHVGTRGFAGGAVLAAGVGVLASIPLLARILFPRLTASIRRSASGMVQAPHLTELQLERTSPTPGPEPDQIGFSLLEMTNIAEKVLREIGLITKFARLIVSLGHGSNSLNNPHKSAYDCGACGGSPGGPNGRAFAKILNDSRVREGLAERGIIIPEDTIFIGGFHNTCNDEVTLFDTENIPDTHREDFEQATKLISDTCDRNAHERCRRFISAPLTMTFPAARRHVEGRAEDLAQTRPECGHASNAICIIGRRSRTQGLYLDRRAFLTSYDPTQDDAESSILARIMGAAVPVCAGINLEYYFSYVDSYGWGCGTKLPHNVSALLGVMDGAASDLRTGLPWQMVEIHEPVRLLFVIETTAQTMYKLMERNPVIGKLVRNKWIQMALLDPHSSRMLVFRNGEFQDYQPQTSELPKADSSTDWYRGWRENLSFASIEA
ncbi:MAG: hypothetical protein JWN70_557 [Planctomycetaceae bacterium]|nr:hypothetical protein [Planctomycetaceae bacterium]